jgi:hypothetical protein
MLPKTCRADFRSDIFWKSYRPLKQGTNKRGEFYVGLSGKITEFLYTCLCTLSPPYPKNYSVYKIYIYVYTL